MIVLCRDILATSFSNQKNKRDFAELNNVKYGLLSVDKWKQQIALILDDEINKLNLSNADEHILKKQIEVQLNTLIDEIDKKIKKTNASSVEGWIKQAFVNIFISLKDIKKGIPQYADAMIQQATKTKTKEEIKILLKKQLEKYFNQTFDSEDQLQIKKILLRIGSPDTESAKVKLEKEILLKRDRIYKDSLLLIVLSLILFSFAGFSKKPILSSQYIPLVLTLIILLIAGIATPMIDMEAKISQMQFVLLEHPIHFKNQVLYFQSKSILDVFWIMIINKSLQMKLVGILMITFSIFFPLLKIISLVSYYYNYHQAKENRWVNFFVLKAGKWSMADVMVVAIFMAYIGFNGIITSQFGHLSSVGQELVILTTNGTSLQPGYYLFLTYTLLALFLSELITRKTTRA